MQSIGNRSVNVGQILQFQISGSDSDKDSLNYYASGLPSGATFSTGTRTFSWKPTDKQLGKFLLTFGVRDSKGSSDRETITISVNKPGASGSASSALTNGQDGGVSGGTPDQVNGQDVKNNKQPVLQEKLGMSRKTYLFLKYLTIDFLISSMIMLIYLYFQRHKKHPTIPQGSIPLS